MVKHVLNSMSCSTFGLFDHPPTSDNDHQGGLLGPPVADDDHQRGASESRRGWETQYEPNELTAIS